MRHSVTAASRRTSERGCSWGGSGFTWGGGGRALALGQQHPLGPRVGQLCEHLQGWGGGNGMVAGVAAHPASTWTRLHDGYMTVT